MARPKLPEHLKRKAVNIKLSPYIIEWLRRQDRSQGAIIEEALIKLHRLKKP